MATTTQTQTPTTKAPPPLGGTFQLATSAAPRRLVVAIDGMERTGKTETALSAPGPIAYQSFDIGHEGVIQKHQDTKTIYFAQYEAVVERGMKPEEVAKANEPVWETFVKDYKLFIAQAKVGKVRTGVIDTASEVWEVLRLARLGKLTQVMPHHYTALNTEYRNLVREVYNTPANLILLHKLKAEWVDNPVTGKGGRTGQFERAGYSDSGFLVQCNVLAYRERNAEDARGVATGPFHLLIKDCRQNPSAAGADLVEPFADFAHLAVTVYPDSNFEDWE